MRIERLDPQIKLRPLHAPQVAVISFDERVAFSSEIEAPTKDILHPKFYNSLILDVERAEDFLRKGYRVIFNFHSTKEITIEALAYLLGNIEVLIHKYKNRINGTYSQHEQVNQLLRDSGFLKQLKFNNEITSAEPFESHLTHLNFRTGTFVEAEAIAPLREEVTKNNIVIPEIYAKKIFRALSEAMLNVHHHAYDGVKFKLPRHQYFKGKWWLGAQFDKNSGILSFAMYDVGQGIPASMPRNYDANYLQKFATPESNCVDADLIYAATQPGKTSTKKRHRGRGLPDMHQIVTNFRGELQIYSGFGKYYFTGKESQRYKMDYHCNGTLALWRIYTDMLVV